MQVTHMLSRLMPAALKRLFPDQPLGALTAGQKTFFDENGYLILPGLFPPGLMARLREHFDHLWETRFESPTQVIDCYFGLPNEERTWFRKAPAEVRDAPYKLLDLHLEDEVIRDVCAAPVLMQVLHGLLEAHPMVCNSLLFERGSQQYPHFDTFFMPSTTKNMMAASWIAIDNVTPTNGPVYYYPKSHLIEPYLFSHGRINAVFSELESGAQPHIRHIIEAHGLERKIFLAEPGDVLIWHAQLLHGGSDIENPAEKRRSLVTHYWTEIDFPDPAQRIDLGDGKWILKRSHQHVVDQESLADVDAFLATLTVSAEMRAAVPDSFDPRLYLARNQDILRAGANPFVHYAEHGRREGRIW
jgi:ectoine hydroxylase-related dioxygenase (phytanoyl-CoA dioxygenase family)